MEEADDDEDTDVSELPPLDRMKKYVFVASKFEFKETLGNITSYFPNAIIVDSADKIDRNTADLVVFLTKYIGRHSLYWAAKAYCKRQDIPHIHVSRTNIDSIAAEIQSLYQAEGK